MTEKNIRISNIRFTEEPPFRKRVMIDGWDFVFKVYKHSGSVYLNVLYQDQLVVGTKLVKESYFVMRDVVGNPIRLYFVESLNPIILRGFSR